MIPVFNEDIRTSLKRQKRQLELVRTIDKITGSHNDLGSFLNSIVQLISKKIGAKYAFAVLFDDNEGRVAASNDKKLFSENDYFLIKRIAFDCARQIKPMVIDNSAKNHKSLNKFKVRHGIAMPIIHANKVIGVYIAFRKQNHLFVRSNFEDLLTIARQTDSVIEHLNVYNELKDKEMELSVLYRIDRLKDSIKNFDTFLNALLDELSIITDAKAAYIMLNDEKGPRFLVKHELKKIVEDNKTELIEISQKAIDAAEIIYATKVSDNIETIMAMPLIFEGMSGVFGVINSRKGFFSKLEKRLLAAVAKQADSAIIEDKEKRKIKDVFGRYVSKDVVEKMLNDHEKNYLKSERETLTVLFSDLRNFTKLAESTDPEKIVEFLNQHFTTMSEVILNNKGTLDKFTGDGVMAIFGAPIYQDNHAFKAVKTALEMMNEHKKMIQKTGMKPEIGIGINTGEMIVGNIGSKLKQEYTAIGDAVNLSARLKDEAKPGQILISKATFEACKDKIMARKLSPIKVKGKEKEIEVYEVIGIK